MNKIQFKIGDRVRMHEEGSWVDGREGTIGALDVTSSDGIHGHRIDVPGHGYTIVEPEFLELLPGGGA